MSKEQENLRQQFIDETKAKLWAEDINEDVGFSDKYVEWLEAKQLILSGVMPSIGRTYSIIENGKRIFGTVESHQGNTGKFWVKWNDGEITLESKIDNCR
jgi:hypothetical protein